MQKELLNSCSHILPSQQLRTWKQQEDEENFHFKQIAYVAILCMGCSVPLEWQKSKFFRAIGLIKVIRVV